MERTQGLSPTAAYAAWCVAATLSNAETAAFSARLLVVDDWQGGDRPLWVEDNEAARIIQLGFSNVPISTPEPRR